MAHCDRHSGIEMVIARSLFLDWRFSLFYWRSLALQEKRLSVLRNKGAALDLPAVSSLLDRERTGFPPFFRLSTGQKSA